MAIDVILYHIYMLYIRYNLYIYHVRERLAAAELGDEPQILGAFEILHEAAHVGMVHLLPGLETP